MLTPELNTKDSPALFHRFLSTATNEFRQMLVPVSPVDKLTAEGWILNLLISVGQNVWREKARLLCFVSETPNPLKADTAEILKN